MKVELRHEQGVIEIFSNAIRLYRQHSQVMLPLAMIAVPLVVGLGYAVASTPPVVGTLLLLPPISVMNVLSAAGIVYVVDQSRFGKDATLGEALLAVGRRSRRLVTTQILALLVKTLTILIFPYFLVRWWFTTQAVMLDDARGGDALAASSDAVLGRWWRTAGVLFIIVVLQGALVLGTLLIARSGAPPDPILWRILISAVSAAWTPLIVCAETVLYFDLKARAKTAALWSSTS